MLYKIRTMTITGGSDTQANLLRWAEEATINATIKIYEFHFFDNPGLRCTLTHSSPLIAVTPLSCSLSSHLASSLLPLRNPNGRIRVLVVGGTNTSHPYSPLVRHLVLNLVGGEHPS